MIPLRDTIRSRTYPFVTYLLIVLNALIFFLQALQGPEEGRFIATYALIPARFTHPALIDYFGFFLPRHLVRSSVHRCCRRRRRLRRDCLVGAPGRLCGRHRTVEGH